MKWRPFIVLSLYFPPFNIHNAANGRNCKVGATLMPFVSLAWDGLRKTYETLKCNTLWNVEQQDSDRFKLLIGWDFGADELIELGV